MKNSDTTIPTSEPELTDAALSEKPTVKGRRRRTHTRKMTISRDDIEECREKDEDDDDQFEKKIVALKKIVPGGETLAVENLFEETADYIASLQYKVEALRFLVTFVECSQNNKRKLGG
ncbi:transcription factor PAR2 [Henckelia pumila]|uniref:transcription factor PAR2 n=1 Tax=Henckelia pumila TaxID=405737 RepID=UPI003C6DE3F5